MSVSGAEYVIFKLGGLTKVANLLGRPITTIQSWKDRGQIPQKHWEYIIEAAKLIDICLTPLDFCHSHEVCHSQNSSNQVTRPAVSEV